ncbi:MAG: CoA transferase [Rhodobiaceae bacterium]|nr:CoA transferase [Rhodobiaceae bacterium]
MAHRRHLPLAGIRVVDFTTLLPGPLAGLMLAEAGATVDKIERPGGEEMRGYRPEIAGQSAFYTALNAGKTVHFLDLKSPEGKAEALDLVASADVLIEQFRPGVMERIGLGAETLMKVNPGLVYCAISGFGQTGPLSARAGHDLNYIGETGLLNIAPGSPSVPPALIADIGGGTFPAVINILLALIRRHKTGEGAVIDIAMTDAMFTFAWWAYAEGVATGRWSGPNEGQLANGSPRYALYSAADGALIAVAALEQKFWDTFCDMIGLSPDLRDDSPDPGATRAEVARLIAQKAAADWEPLLETADCCVSVVRSLADAVRHPHFRERGLFSGEILLADGETIPALPVPLSPEFRVTGQRKAPRET